MTKASAFLLLFLGSLRLFSQVELVTYEAKDKELIKIFKELEKEYGIFFAYATPELKDKKSTIDRENASLSTFLTELLEPHQLAFEQIEEQFISIKRAQSALIRLAVLDESSLEPLPFATARIAGTYEGYISDKDGKMEMVLSDPDQKVLEISFVGYEPLMIKVDSLKASELISIKLNRSVKELEEIVIKEYLNKGITTDEEASRITIDVQDMEILPGLSERDILLSTQILAGVGSADESAAGINIRGSSRDNTTIYWNNIPVYQPAHYFGNISSFIPSAIGKVEVHKNNIPVKYGAASSGLLLIETRKEKELDPAVESNINLTHTDLYANGPFAQGAGSILLAGRRSYNDLFATTTFNSISDKLFEGSFTQALQEDINEGAFDYNSKIVFSDLNLAVDFEPDGENKFSLSALHSRSKLNYSSINDDDTFESEQIHNVESFGFNANWTRRWSDPISTELSTSFADYHMDYSLFTEREEEDERSDDLVARANNIDNWETRWTVTYKPSSNQYLSGGIQFNEIQSDFSTNEQLFFEGDFNEEIISNGRSQAAFADYFGRFNSGLQIGAGVRFNSYELVDANTIDWQVRLNHSLNEHLILKSSVGRYNQNISSLKEFDFIFSNTIEQNWVAATDEADVPIITNDQVVVGALFEKDGWLIDSDLFLKQVTSPIYRGFGPQVDDESDLLVGIESITGVDLTIKKRWKFYRAWISYTFQDSEVSLDDDLEVVPFVSGLNVKHQLQLSQTYSYRQFEFSTGFTIKSGLPYTQAVGFDEITPDEPEEDSFFEIRYGPINGNRLPTYYRFDLSAWYKFPRKESSGIHGELGISVLNVFDNINFFSRTYSIEEDEEDEVILVQFDQRLIGITPNVSLRLRF